MSSMNIILGRVCVGSSKTNTDRDFHSTGQFNFIHTLLQALSSING